MVLAIYLFPTHGTTAFRSFTTDGICITEWKGDNIPDGSLSSPGGIAVDKSGNICVTDINRNHALKFTGSGSFISVWESNFNHTSSIAVDANGDVYVGDADLIQKFSTNALNIVSDELKSYISVYQNITESETTLEIKNMNITDGKVSISNLQGLAYKSLEYRGESMLIIDVSTLPAGLYVIRVHTNTINKITKLIKR